MAPLASASLWIERFAPLVRAGAPVLDLACGHGRHVRLFHAQGHPVTAVDIDLGGLGALTDDPEVEAIGADLEDGSPWPLPGRQFGAVVVTNYLWRPLWPHILAAIDPGGLLLYETFAVGNETFGKPNNPAFLLRPGELLEVVAGRFQVIAYEHGLLATPRPAIKQRIAAIRDDRPAAVYPIR